MAFKSKDGKRNFGNRQQAQSYDNRSSSKDSGEKQPYKESMPAESDADGGRENAGQEQSPMDLHEHMAEHGPAEKVEIEHHEGKHTKISHHSGAKHVSHHESAEEAHQHGMMAAGIEQQEPEQEMQQPAMAGGMGSGIPGM